MSKLLDFIFLGEQPASKWSRVTFIAIPTIVVAYALGHPV
jgi:hypothetical protein